MTRRYVKTSIYIRSVFDEDGTKAMHSDDLEDAIINKLEKTL